MSSNMNALESKFIEVNGVRLHYQETGSGSPVVCLHGAGPGASSASNFKLNVKAFSQNHHAVLYDMPQFGDSAKIPITEGRLVYNARMLKNFLDAIGLHKVDIVGNSMGGQVGLKFGIDYPDRLGKIVIIGSGAVPPVFAPYPVEGVRMINQFYKGGGPTRDKLRTLLNTIVYDPSLVSDAVFEERWLVATRPDVVELFGKLQGPLPRESLANDLPDLKARLLTIWGMDDRMGALDVGIQITRLVQDARMHVFNKCGHWAQVEHAQEFNRLVVDFLDH